MVAISRTSIRYAVIVLIVLAMGSGAALLYWRWESTNDHEIAETATKKVEPPPIELDSIRDNTFRLASYSEHKLGVTYERVKRSPNTRILRLTGSTFIDPNRLVHMHSRFPGEVVEMGRLSDGTSKIADDDDPKTKRSIRAGDFIKKDQVLARMWCKELGEKKSDLVDSLSQLYLDESVLKRLNKLENGVIPQRTVDEAVRKFEADKIAVARAERTLRSWRISEEEIAEVQAEAQRIRRGERLENPATANDSWAEAIVRAPIDGVILEQNIVPGDMVDTNIDIFKLADLSRIGVMANIYEEDLSKLERLPVNKRQWRIQLKAEPGSPEIHGTFELIGNLVDSSQHTAIVVGWLDNPNNRLRIGQFITATIDLPAPEDMMVVPERAVVGDGPKSYVFVAESPSPESHAPDDMVADIKNTARKDCALLTRRQVAMTHLADGLAFIRAKPTRNERRKGCQEIAEGEKVVTSGVVELAGALKIEKSKAKAKLQPMASDNSRNLE